MALKFLNKKGWHTGSLRNIENVWKAEQKNDAEQKKLEELKKQIHEERERAEFRQLQEQAGLVPRQERLEFLYDSGLAVGKGSSSSGFKELESYPKPPDPQAAVASSSSSAQQQSAPGALFVEEKPQSANDSWRKLHSDPLLLIRKREQEAIARVKNNPVQMAMIRKSVEAVKDKKDTQHGKDGKEHKTKHRHKKSKHRKHSSSKHHSDLDNSTSDDDERKPKNRKGLNHEESSYRRARSPDDQFNEEDLQRKRTTYKDSKNKEVRPSALYDAKNNKNEDLYKSKREHESSDHGNNKKEDLYKSKREHERADRGNYYSRSRPDSEHESSDHGNNKKDDLYKSKREHESADRGNYYSRSRPESDYVKKDRVVENFAQGDRLNSSDTAARRDSSNKRRNPVKLSEEERAARLREMQMNAEMHEEQRWKRIKKAEEKDVQEAIEAQVTGGRNFLDAAQRSVYGAEKGGSSTIEESVRRRKYYSQNRSGATESNAFRR